MPMIKTITQNDVVNYLYQSNAKEDKDLTSALICNEGLADVYYELENSKKMLNNHLLSPSMKCQKNILEFAKKSILKK